MRTDIADSRPFLVNFSFVFLQTKTSKFDGRGGERKRQAVGHSAAVLTLHPPPSFSLLTSVLLSPGFSCRTTFISEKFTKKPPRPVSAGTMHSASQLFACRLRFTVNFFHVYIYCLF